MALTRVVLSILRIRTRCLLMRAYTHTIISIESLSDLSLVCSLTYRSHCRIADFLSLLSRHFLSTHTSNHDPLTVHPLTHPITILSLSALLSIFRSPSHPGNASYYFLGIPYGKARRFEASSAVDNLTDYPGQTLNAQQFGSCCWAPPEKVKESRQVELPCASTRCDICASTPFDYQAFCIEYVHLSRVPLTRT